MTTDFPGAIVFDLDDTLYLERDFVKSGFRAASIWLEEETGTQGLDKICLSLFNSGQRTEIFDSALAKLNVPQNMVESVVEVYRNHSPEISLTNDAKQYFENASKHLFFGLITDGRASTQLAKIRRLELEPILNFIRCTGDWGREFWKPHPRSFEDMEQRSGLHGASLAYIADNPLKDFITPKERGWRTVQIARPERVHTLPAPTHEYCAHATITSLDDLNECLIQLDTKFSKIRLLSSSK
jgi:putative hydrolase of the HAD superfamily